MAAVFITVLHFRCFIVGCLRFFKWQMDGVKIQHKMILINFCIGMAVRAAKDHIPNPVGEVLRTSAKDADKLKKSALVCNCGLPDERIYPDLSLERPQEQAGYFATVLVKE